MLKSVIRLENSQGWGPWIPWTIDSVSDNWVDEYNHPIHNKPCFPPVILSPDVRQANAPLLPDTEDRVLSGCTHGCAFLEWFGQYLPTIDKAYNMQISFFRIPTDKVFSTYDDTDAIIYTTSKPDEHVEQCMFLEEYAEKYKTIVL